MSDFGKAVFLSYASQDAEAVMRVAEALRAAGAEVWFDQNELVGGDAWDAKIRKQIAECALFVPVISASTQARLEGYFRIEWKLAARRTHAMATAKAFLLPVVIDGTHDTEAHVPDEFREVQWTRLPGGETPERFCLRVKKLLGGEVAPASSRQPDDAGKMPALPRQQPSLSRLVPAFIGVALLAAVMIWRPWRRGTPPVGSGAVAVAPPTASLASELDRVRARIVPDRWQREDFEAVSATLDRLIQANPEQADAWALRSLINSLQVVRNFESGTKPLEVGKSAAERALRLAPGSPLGELALGMHLTAMFSRGGDAGAARPHIERGLAGLPRDALTRYADLTSRWLSYQFEDTQRSAEAWLAEEPRASFPAWILAQMHGARRRPDDAEKWASQAAADNDITGIRSLVTIFESRYYLRADLPGARAALNRLPAGARPPHRLMYSRWLLAMAEQQWDQALQEIAGIPEPVLFDRNFHGPKALLAGLAHQAAGRAEPALAQFREAERVLRAELAPDPDNEELRAVLAVSLASAGRGDEARSELAAIEPLIRGRRPSVYSGGNIALIAQAYAAMADVEKTLPWLRRLLAEPSALPFTPASVRVDPRFSRVIAHPAVRALLAEFATLDQPSPALASADDKSVAVLAFANLSDDKANEYFSDGISEELLNVLAKIPDLKVSARTSAFSFKGKSVPIPEIARQLGVAYVVEGSVRKSGNRVRITAELIKAADGFHLWSENFDRELKDVFSVQDEIAGLIARNLSLKIGAVAATPAVVNVDAYQHLFQARFFSRQDNNDGWRRSIDECRAALDLDPNFALAAAEMARSYIQLARFGGITAEEAYRLARAPAERALALNPQLAEAHDAMGWVQRTADWNWRGADASFRRAYELAPRNATVISDYAIVRANQGDVRQARELGRRALEFDPLNASPRAHYALFLNWGDAPRLEEGLAEMRRALEMSPAAIEWHAYVARFLVLLNRLDEAAAVAEQEPGERYRLQARGLVLVAQQKRAAAETVIRELSEKYGDTMGYYLAEIYASARENDRAFEWLERAREHRETALCWVRGSPALQPITGDPRWPEFLRKIGHDRPEKK